jgi:oxygen-independent coproporphyrinogen III oxidase
MLDPPKFDAALLWRHDRPGPRYTVDLIYGLPRQTLQGFLRTLRLVMSARPDSVAVYSYAHLPNLFKAQRHIETKALPGPEARLDLVRLAIEELSAGGRVRNG